MFVFSKLSQTLIISLKLLKIIWYQGKSRYREVATACWLPTLPIPLNVCHLACNNTSPTPFNLFAFLINISCWMLRLSWNPKAQGHSCMFVNLQPGTTFFEAFCSKSTSRWLCLWAEYWIRSQVEIHASCLHLQLFCKCRFSSNWEPIWS